MKHISEIIPEVMTEIQTKRCLRCKEDKEKNEFTEKAVYCRSCVSIKNRKKYVPHYQKGSKTGYSNYDYVIGLFIG